MKYHHKAHTGRKMSPLIERHPLKKYQKVAGKTSNQSKLFMWCLYIKYCLEK